RASVVAQFHSSAPLDAQSPVISTFRLSKPGCPLAVRIVGWYLASFVLFLPFLPFFPKRIPAFFFGHLFRGPAALMFLFLYFALLSLAIPIAILVTLLVVRRQFFAAASGIADIPS